MKEMDVVIVGGSAAGSTATITARRYYPDKTILVVRRERQVPVPCGIPHIFGSIGDAEHCLMPDALLEKNNIELMIAEATCVDARGKVLTTEFEDVLYERLLLATGSSPAEPPIPGLELDGIFHIRKEIPYLCQMQKRLAVARNVVVIGGGFIGIELADEINKAGNKRVTVVEVAPYCLNLAYDKEFCIRMEEHVQRRGVAIRTNVKVERIVGSSCVEYVILSDGEQLAADVVILAVGVVPNSGLARTAGVDVGPRTGAIVVDQAMRTSVKDIFACGDCAMKTSFFGGIPSTLRLASIATSEARIAGANLFGIRRSLLRPWRIRP